MNKLNRDDLVLDLRAIAQAVADDKNRKTSFVTAARELGDAHAGMFAIASDPRFVSTVPYPIQVLYLLFLAEAVEQGDFP